MLARDAFLIFDGRRRGLSLEELARQISQERGCIVTPEDIETASNGIEASIEQISKRPKSSFYLFRIPLIPARLVSKIASRLTWMFNSKVASVTVALAAVMTVASLATGNHVWRIGTTAGWLSAYALFIASVILHEFGHAAACRAFGAKPSSIGLTSFFVLPAFYSDVSSSWALSRWQRFVVDMSGMYFQCAPLAAVAGAALITKSSVCYVAEILILMGFTLNINPVLRLDGYWALADALDVPNLAAQPMKIVLALIQGKRPVRWSVPQICVILCFGLLNTMAWGYFIYAAVVALLIHGPKEILAAMHAMLYGQFGLNDAILLLVTLLTLTMMALGLVRMAKALFAATARLQLKSRNSV